MPSPESPLLQAEDIAAAAATSVAAAAANAAISIGTEQLPLWVGEYVMVVPPAAAELKAWRTASASALFFVSGSRGRCRLRNNWVCFPPKSEENTRHSARNESTVELRGWPVH